MKKQDTGVFSFLFTAQNYVRAFHSVYFAVFVKTIIVSGIATFCCLLIGFPLAYQIAKWQGPAKRLGLILIFIPFWTNFILRIHGIISLFGREGLINQLFLKLNWIETPIPFLFNRFGIFLGLIYNYLPFLVIPIYSSLEKFDFTLKEASYDLGATRFQTFWKVLLPNVREGILVGSLFIFIPMLGEYVIPEVLGGSKELFFGNILVSQFYTLQDWPFGASLSILLSIFLVLPFFVNKGQGKRTTP